MSKKGVHIFLWIPLLMLLLHSVTPHHHESARERLSVAQQHQCPSNLLSDVFQFDLGFNHLEEFEISDFQPDLNTDLIVLSIIELDFEFVEIQSEKPVSYEVSLPINHQYLATTHTLWAPPSLLV